jgi:hypothetical protein
MDTNTLFAIFPVVIRLASLSSVLGEKHAALLEATIKQAKNDMDFLARGDALAGALGIPLNEFRRTWLGKSGSISPQVITEWNNYVDSVQAGGDPIYGPLMARVKNEAPNFFDFFNPNRSFGLYDSIFGGASLAIKKGWSSEESKAQAGLSGITSSDIVQVMMTGGLMLPGDIWDNRSGTYSPRTKPLFPIGENVLYVLGAKKPTIGQLKNQLTKSAERTSLRWLSTVDTGFRSKFVGQEDVGAFANIPQWNEDPLTPEELIATKGWFDRVEPKARFRMRSSPGQLNIFDVIVKMKDQGRDPLRFGNGKLSLEIKKVQEWMESNGMEVPSSQRIGLVFQKVMEHINAAFDEVFASVQQDLVDEESQKENKRLNKHNIEDSRDQLMSRSEQIKEVIRMETRGRRAKAQDQSTGREIEVMKKAMQTVATKVSSLEDMRSSIIRLAHSNPELRPHLLPLLK